MTSIEKIINVANRILDIYSKQLTYAFGGIAAVLIVLLIFSGAVIKTMTLKVNRKYLYIVHICVKFCLTTV